MMPTSAIKQQVVGGKYATVGKDGGEKGEGTFSGREFKCRNIVDGWRGGSESIISKI